MAGQELIIDSSLLSAWGGDDPGATRHKYAGKKSVFGYKVHTLLCHQADLPLFVLATPAHVPDSQVGWFLILVAAGLFGLKVLVVYADAAYFDRRLFRVVHHILGAHQAIHYNLRKAGKKKLASLEFLEQWQRLVTAPRTAIERHFAWLIGCLHPSDFAVLSPPQRLDVESGDGRSALLDREATDTRVRSRLAKEASSCRRDP